MDASSFLSLRIITGGTVKGVQGVYNFHLRRLVKWGSSLRVKVLCWDLIFKSV